MPSAAAASSSRSVVGGALSRVGRPASRAAVMARALLPARCRARCRRADEGDAVRRARLGEVGVLRHEAVAGVDRVGAALDGHAHDVVVVEVGADRVAGLADLVGLVGLEPVLGGAVLVREDGHGLCAELRGGSERANRDLPTVGDEDLVEHGGTSGVWWRDVINPSDGGSRTRGRPRLRRDRPGVPGPARMPGRGPRATRQVGIRLGVSVLHGILDGVRRSAQRQPAHTTEQRGSEPLMGVIGFDIGRLASGKRVEDARSSRKRSAQTNRCRFQAHRLRPRRLSEPEVRWPRFDLDLVTSVI